MTCIRRLNRQFFLKSAVVIMIGVLSLFFTHSASAQQTFKYKYFSFTPMASFGTQFLVQFAKEAKELSKNRLDIRVYPQGELPYQPTDAIDISSKGLVELANTEVSYAAGAVPLAPLVSFPLLVNSMEEALKVGRVFMPHLDKAIQEKYNAKLLWWYTWPNRKILGKGEVPKSLADMKGKKIRFPGPIGSEFLTRLGMVPVNLPPGDIAVALQRGTLDGTSGAYVYIDSFKWYELCNWGYEIKCGAVYNLTIMNKAAYEKLPPDLKKILDDLAEKYQVKCAEFGYDREDKTKEKFQKAGIVFVEPSEKDLAFAKEKILPFWDEWAQSKGPAAVQALKEVRQVLGQ